MEREEYIVWWGDKNIIDHLPPGTFPLIEDRYTLDDSWLISKNPILDIGWDPRPHPRWHLGKPKVPIILKPFPFPQPLNLLPGIPRPKPYPRHPMKKTYKTNIIWKKESIYFTT